jgi:hypothetical protein
MVKIGEVEMQGFSSCRSTPGGQPPLGFHTITLSLALFPAQPKEAYLGDQSLLYGQGSKCRERHRMWILSYATRVQVLLSIQSLSYLTTSERILVYTIGSTPHALLRVVSRIVLKNR